MEGIRRSWAYLENDPVKIQCRQEDALHTEGTLTLTLILTPTLIGGRSPYRGDTGDEDDASTEPFDEDAAKDC